MRKLIESLELRIMASSWLTSINGSRFFYYCCMMLMKQSSFSTFKINLFTIPHKLQQNSLVIFSAINLNAISAFISIASTNYLFYPHSYFNLLFFIYVFPLHSLHYLSLLYYFLVFLCTDCNCNVTSFFFFTKDCFYFWCMRHFSILLH